MDAAVSLHGSIHGDFACKGSRQLSVPMFIRKFNALWESSFLLFMGASVGRSKEHFLIVGTDVKVIY